MSQIRSSEPVWEVRDRKLLCQTPHLSVWQECVKSPHQTESVEWVTIDRKCGVVIAPRLSDGRWLLIREDRIPARRSFWSFPAGQVDHAVSDDGLETAKRELIEETHHDGGAGWQFLGKMYASPGFTNERMWMWFAEGVRPLNSPEVLEPGILEMCAFSSQELLEMVEQDEICDANTLSALTRLMARDLLQPRKRKND